MPDADLVGLAHRRFGQSVDEVDPAWNLVLHQALCKVVAQQWGIAPSTVRRRVRRSVDALASACTGNDWRVSA